MQKKAAANINSLYSQRSEFLLSLTVKLPLKNMIVVCKAKRGPDDSYKSPAAYLHD